MIVFVAAVLTTGWVALLIAAPVLPGWAGAVVYGIGSLVCHQIPERSFHFAGFQLPVCARCLGIYLGAFAGAGAMWMRANPAQSRLAIAPATARRLVLVTAIPTLLTLTLEMAGIWSPSNVTRAIAGVPLGVTITLVVVSALATLHYDECVPPRPSVPKPPH